MELWIRSQEGTLGKVLFIRPAGLALDIHFVGNYTTSEHFKTEERALEVLDEIQNILKPKYILDSSSIKPDGDSWVENGMIIQSYKANTRIEELSTYVYEMPLD